MIKNIIKTPRVIVAMSGGVDSSVAALLLTKKGYDVIGVSLKLWDYDEDERRLTGKTCCSLDDIADAKEVCDKLKIPFYAFNYKAEFERSVIQNFVSEYKNGRTPNPCILCNQHIKFAVLLKEAQKMGADYLATGHYARLKKDVEGKPHLLKGKDRNKDQSYVLFSLRQEELQHLLFPVGEYTKSEIRTLATQHGLATAQKKESMDICFIPNNDHASFIAKNYPGLKSSQGNFVDLSGHILGKHEGIEKYTIGQRRGLNVSLGNRAYVLEIRKETAEIVLAKEGEIFFQGLVGKDFRFLYPPDQKTKLGVKIRYQQDEIPVEIKNYDDDNKRIELKFLSKARAVTPGQAAVLYKGQEVIGGGWIERPLY